jgi:hypothetical protein
MVSEQVIEPISKISQQQKRREISQHQSPTSKKKIKSAKLIRENQQQIQDYY